MLTAIQQELVDRLESGKIPQTQHVLGRPGGSRCCLGVACDIAVEHGIIGLPFVDEMLSTASLRYGDSWVYLPKEVQKFFGFRSADAYYTINNGASRTLVEANDSGKSFAEIAQIIRDNADSLFCKDGDPL